MSDRSTKKLVREGDFVAEVDVRLIEDESDWSPYLSPEDAFKPHSGCWIYSATNSRPRP